MREYSLIHMLQVVKIFQMSKYHIIPSKNHAHSWILLVQIVYFHCYLETHIMIKNI